MSSFSKQIWVIPPLNPSKDFSDPPFWVLSYYWSPPFVLLKILWFPPQNPPPPTPKAIHNDRSLKSGSLEKTTVHSLNFSFLAQHKREIGDRSVICIILHLFYCPVQSVYKFSHHECFQVLIPLLISNVTAPEPQRFKVNSLLMYKFCLSSIKCFVTRCKLLSTSSYKKNNVNGPKY